MIVIFLRHGEAEEAGHDVPGKDAKRKLTSRGRKETLFVARALNRLKLRPGSVFSSPLVRAFQTAEIASAELKGAAEPVLLQSLAPGHRWVNVREGITRTMKHLKDPGDVVLVCGHQPDMGMYLADAISRHPGAGTEIRKSGAVCVEWAGIDLSGPGRICFAIEPEAAKRLVKIAGK